MNGSLLLLLALPAVVLFFSLSSLPSANAVKLQNYLSPDSSVVDPEVKASLVERQAKFLAFYTVRFSVSKELISQDIFETI